MIDNIYPLMILAVITSFMGFCVENLWLLFTKGYMDNRNMKLPFLFGYGLAVTGFYVVLGIPSEFIAGRIASENMRVFCYFAITVLLVSLGEICVGFFTEKYFGFYYWNYEKLPLHFTRYTSLPTSCGFSLIITTFMNKCFMPLLTVLEKIPTYFLRPVALLLFIAIALDFVKSFRIMHRTGKPNVTRVWYPKGRPKSLRIKRT